MKPYLTLTAIFSVTAALALTMDRRIARAGEWLPPVAQKMGNWTARETPMDKNTLAILGRPRTLARAYANGKGATVNMSVIAANGLDAYHEPAICAAGSGFQKVDEQTVPVGGVGTYTDIRMMAFRRGPQRVVMCYWTQTRDGKIESDQSFMQTQGLDRLSARRPTWAALFAGRQTCVMHVYEVIPPADKTGQAACRHVLEISRGIYDSLRRG